MPHFIIECSANVIWQTDVDAMLREIHDTAEATGLFKPGDIKVRLTPFEYYSAGNRRTDFIHVFAHILEGRTTEQKADLSQRIVTKLKVLFPNVQVIAMNIYEFERASYNNLDSI